MPSRRLKSSWSLPKLVVGCHRMWIEWTSIHFSTADMAPMLQLEPWQVWSGSTTRASLDGLFKTSIFLRHLTHARRRAKLWWSRRRCWPFLKSRLRLCGWLVMNIGPVCWATGWWQLDAWGINTSFGQSLVAFRFQPSMRSVLEVNNETTGRGSTSPCQAISHLVSRGPNTGSQRSRLWVRLRGRTVACALTAMVSLGRWVKSQLKLRSSSETMSQMPRRWRPTASGVGDLHWGNFSSCPLWSSTRLEIGRTKVKLPVQPQCRCTIQLRSTQRAFELSTSCWGACTRYVTSKLGKWSHPRSWWKQRRWDGRLWTKLSAGIATRCGLFRCLPMMSGTSFEFQVNWLRKPRPWSPRAPIQRQWERCHPPFRGKCCQPTWRTV